MGYSKEGGANIGIGIQKNMQKAKSQSKSDEFFSKFEGKITYQGWSFTHVWNDKYTF